MPVQSAGNRLADRRLTYTGRTDQTNNLTLDRTAQFANGKELKDSILDILKAKVVFVKYVACA